MRIQLWKNEKQNEESPDYRVLQKQRVNDGTTAYETVEVGYGYKKEAPSGETYLDVTIRGFNNNKPI